MVRGEAQRRGPPSRYNGTRQGRFLSVDPKLDIDKAIHNPQMWNRYSYVENNPINKTDPDGRTPQWVVGGIAGAYAGLYTAAYSEIKRSLNEPVTFGGNLRRVSGAVVGGAVSGALGATCGSCAWSVRLAAGVEGTMIGGLTNRFVSGQPQTLDAAQRDAIGGAAGVVGGEVLAKGVHAAAQGAIDDLVMKAAVQRAEAAAQNGGLGADKLTNQVIQQIRSVLVGVGVAGSETLSNATGSSLPQQTNRQVPAPCTGSSTAGCTP